MPAQVVYIWSTELVIDLEIRVGQLLAFPTDLHELEYSLQKQGIKKFLNSNTRATIDE